MKEKKPAVSDGERVTYYLGILAGSINQCADHRAGDLDTFLLNARRVVEAMLYALATGTEADPTRKESKKRSLDDVPVLAKTLGDMGRLQRASASNLDHIRSFGNIGAHIQPPDQVATAEDVEACRFHFEVPIRWLFERSELKQDMPPLVAKALEDLMSSTPRRSEGDVRAQNKTLAADLAKALAAGPSETELHARNETLEADVERLQGELTVTRAALLRTQGAAPATKDPVAPANRRTALLVAVLSLSLGLALGVPLTFAGDRLLASRASDVAVSPTSALDVGAQRPPAPVGGAVVEALLEMPDAGAEAPAPPPLVCSDGRVLVPAGVLVLESGPFPRAGWPDPGTMPAPVDVPAFCIAQQPVTTEDLAACVDAHECPAIPRVELGAGCNLAERALNVRALAANCVRQSDAHAFCAARGGRLASVAEWERAVRVVRDSLMLLPGTDEWVEDPFPPPIFGYRGGDGLTRDQHIFHSRLVPAPRDGSVRLSWNRRAEGAERPRTLSFRCTFDPT